MNNALLEIGVEHLPARFLIPAFSQMETLAADALNTHNLKFESLRAFGTYRRLVLEIKGLEDKAQDIQKEVKGPPAKLLKDENGQYTQQALGFAAKNGITAKQLTVVETDKGPFIYANVKIKGEKTQKILALVFVEIIKGLTFPKNMVWEESGFRFARPIRSLIGLYGTKVVPFEIAGVKSSRNTYPISSFGRKPIKIESPEVYTETLRNQPQPILVELEDRRKALINAVNAATAKLGYKADLDEDLITETISFTEHPVVLTGDMDIKFLELPKELITTVLKKQLRMFPVLNDNGQIQPHFIAVRDGISVNQDEVRIGFKNVMTARLTDAVFFFENDIKTGLSKMKEKLASVNFIDGCGNMLDKTARVEGIALDIAKVLGLNAQQTQNISEAASFCYADLTSGVVYEFPELQGYMGGVYAQKAPMKDAVSKALGEFYLPLTASSELPQSVEGSVLALAGKIDTLAANFTMGQIPSGSEDPYALRRSSMGAVRIIKDNNFNITLQQVIDIAAKYMPEAENSKLGQLYGFMWQRAANILEQLGIAHDEVAAVSELKNRTLPQIVTIAKALNKARQGEALSAVGEAAKRVGNILKKAQFTPTDVEQKLFSIDAEESLFNVLNKIEAEISSKLDYNITEEACGQAFAMLAEFKQPLEYYFEKVMVNDPDERLRTNRLSLLARINGILTSTAADLSKLQKRG